MLASREQAGLGLAWDWASGAICTGGRHWEWSPGAAGQTHHALDTTNRIGASANGDARGLVNKTGVLSSPPPLLATLGTGHWPISLQGASRPWQPLHAAGKLPRGQQSRAWALGPEDPYVCLIPSGDTWQSHSFLSLRFLKPTNKGVQRSLSPRSDVSG